jgi:hypothetical protein
VLAARYITGLAGLSCPVSLSNRPQGHFPA